MRRRTLLLAASSMLAYRPAWSRNVITNGGTTAPPAGVSLISHTQIPGSSGNGGTSPGINTSGASLIVVSISQYKGAILTPPTDSLGNTWVGLTAQSNPTETYNRLFYCSNPTVGAAHTFTATGSAIALTAQIAAFSGVLPSSPLDSQNGSISSGTSISAGNITPSLAGSLVIAGLSNDMPGGGPVTTAGGFTILDQSPFVSAIVEGGALAYQIQTAIATVNCGWLFSTGVPSASCTQAVFKP